MRNKLEKDRKKRIIFKLNELSNLKLKMIINNQILSLYDKHQILSTAVSFCGLQQSNIPLHDQWRKTQRNGLSRIRNRCIMTGRSRSVIKEWKMSRMKFRELADQGYISGIRRSSW